MIGAAQVPGVYYEARRRVPDPRVRTDVVGFVGFDPRVRDGSTRSTLTGGSTPSGHVFRVDVARIGLMFGATQRIVGPFVDFELSADPVSIPMLTDEALAYALTAVDDPAGMRLHAAAGVVRAAGLERAPDDAAIRADVGSLPFVRIADVHVRRDGAFVFVTAHPFHRLTRCDDLRDYVLAFGEPVRDGSVLGDAVRAFFANGGRRCYVSTVLRPSFDDAVGLAAARRDFVGLRGASERDATGFERLLLVDEVTVVDVPDLHAVTPPPAIDLLLPPPDRDACFHDCGAFSPPRRVRMTGTGEAMALFSSDPLYTPGPPELISEVFATQRDLVARAQDECHRVLVLLSVPMCLDFGTGYDTPPSALFANAWRDQFHTLVTQTGFASTQAMSCAALYFPWLEWQETVGQESSSSMPPSAYAAGVLARRDLARGATVAPANESLRQVVGVSTPVFDLEQALLHEPDVDASGYARPSVNVMRPFARAGVVVWGARTLSTDRWLKQISVRRTLTYVTLQMRAALRPFSFEPHTNFLWLRVIQTALGVLLPLYERGMLRGDSPEQAFYVRCDAQLNTPDDIAAGRLTVEIGVAAAAPAEFLVFRVGRREGVVEVLE
jgi:uncharacterized protein